MRLIEGLDEHGVPLGKERGLAGNDDCFSDIHGKKPKELPMSARMSRANDQSSKVSLTVEHVFECQKSPMWPFIRTIGSVRAAVKIGIANLAHDLTRPFWPEGRDAPG